MKCVKMSATAQDFRSRDLIFRDALLRFNVFRQTNGITLEKCRKGKTSRPRQPAEGVLSLAGQLYQLSTAPTDRVQRVAAQ